jgi:hypothetical protein
MKKLTYKQIEEKFIEYLPVQFRDKEINLYFAPLIKAIVDSVNENIDYNCQKDYSDCCKCGDQILTEHANVYVNDGKHLKFCVPCFNTFMVKPLKEKDDYTDKHGEEWQK